MLSACSYHWTVRYHVVLSYFYIRKDIFFIFLLNAQINGGRWYLFCQFNPLEAFGVSTLILGWFLSVCSESNLLLINFVFFRWWNQSKLYGIIRSSNTFTVHFNSTTRPSKSPQSCRKHNLPTLVFLCQ